MIPSCAGSSAADVPLALAEHEAVPDRDASEFTAPDGRETTTNTTDDTLTI
jgi:hypothetical protein